jgi:hypothetical protein
MAVVAPLFCFNMFFVLQDRQGFYIHTVSSLTIGMHECMHTGYFIIHNIYIHIHTHTYTHICSRQNYMKEYPKFPELTTRIENGK